MLLLVLFAAGAVASFAGTRTTVQAFRGAAMRMEQDADALARLRAAIISTALLRSAAVQRLGVEPSRLRATSVEEAASFENAIRTLRPGAGREIVERQFARSKELWPADITTLSPAEFLARTTDAQANFALIEEAAEASRAHAQGELDRAQVLERNISIATAAASLLLLALVVRFARQLSREVLRPVARLRDSADRLAAGELDHRVEVERADEIGDLAATFNTMLDVIADSHRTLTLQANTTR